MLHPAITTLQSPLAFVQLAPGHVTPPPQEEAPRHEVSQAHAEAHFTPPAHAEVPLHVAEHFPVPHVTTPLQEA